MAAKIETDKSGIDRPQFERGNASLGYTRHGDSETERFAADPTQVDKKLMELVASSSSDVRASMNLIRSLAEAEKALQRLVHPVFITDLLDGRTNSNVEGIVGDLGYEPELDDPVGYMTTDLHGGHLVFPIKDEAKDGTGEYWRVLNAESIKRSASLYGKSPLKELVSTGGGHLEAQPVRFGSKQEAMATIHQDFTDNGYDVMQAEPRLSSPLSPGALATAATHETV